MSRQRYKGFDSSTTDRDKRTRYLSDTLQDGFDISTIPVSTDRDFLERGQAFSVTDAYKMRYDYAMWNKQNAYNEQIYDRYQSPKALMDQYAQAGINPMMVAGGSMPQGSLGSDSAPDASSASGTSPETTSNKFQQILGVISSLFGVGSQISQAFTSAKTRKQNQQFQQQELELKGQQTAAQVAKTDEETKGLKIDNTYKSLEKSLDIALKAGQVSKQDKENALLEFNVQVNKNVTPEAAAQNILTKFNLDTAQVAKTEADTEKSKAETANLNALTNKIHTLLSSELRSFEDSHKISELDRGIKRLEKFDAQALEGLKVQADKYGLDRNNTALLGSLSYVLTIKKPWLRDQLLNRLREMSASNGLNHMALDNMFNDLYFSVKH